MIFKTLILNNFRVFNGETVIDLSPRKDGLLAKPVILFGGLNGAGKTSILTGIRLALLGKMAIGKSVTKKEYNNYLASQINNKARKDLDKPFTNITLEFTHTHQGKHATYKVVRSWSEAKDESLAIYKSGVRDDSLSSEQVQSFLHELVPPGIGDLFFFDGEKIAELAEDDTGEYLKVAVQKLLGLDVINRLTNDLEIYVKQQGKNAADKKTLGLIEDLEREKKALLNRANKERELESIVATKLSEVTAKVSKIEQKIQEKGGAWAQTKADEKAKVDTLLSETKLLSNLILKELEGAFPICLAPTAVSKLIKSLDKEEAEKESLSFTKKLKEHMPHLESLFDSSNVTEQLMEYFAQTEKVNEDLVKLDISRTDLSSVKLLVEESAYASKKSKELQEQLSYAENSLAKVSVNVQRAPSEEELHSLYKELRVLDDEKHKLTSKYKAHLIEAKSLMGSALDIAKKLEKMYSSQKLEAAVSNVISRVDSTHKVLGEFTEQLTYMRVKQLETLFSKSYKKLARKDDLKLMTKINPDTFDVDLIDSDGLKINRKSMSAGEKQIFAFAILEALGQLSGKVLPVVVDTPLGRLDSKHRDKLVKHYFPEAGEQVILLSTDTEVDEDFFDAMAPEISHAFEIEFNQVTKCSTLSEGYFWGNKSNVTHEPNIKEVS